MKRIGRRILSVCLTLLLLSLPLLTSAASRTANPYAAYVSVKEFGAKGDGQTEDNEAFRAAIKAAQSRKLPVLIPAGTYLINESIEVPAGVNLLGETAASNGPWQNPQDGAEKGMPFHGSTDMTNYAMYAGTWILAANGMDNVEAGATFMLRGDNTISHIGFVNMLYTPCFTLGEECPPLIGADIDKMTSNKGLVIEDISLFNPYIGIAVYRGSLSKAPTGTRSSKTSGPVTIRNIMGGPIYCGILLQGVDGAVTMDNLQFNYAHYASSVVTPRSTKAVEIVLRACDKVTLSNLLSYGARTGILTEPAFSGMPVNFTGNNLNIEGGEPVIFRACGDHTIRNSYLLNCDPVGVPVERLLAIQVLQDTAGKVTASHYTFDNIVWQLGASSNNRECVFADVSLCGGTMSMTSAIMWGAPSVGPYFRYKHESGPASQMTVTNLTFCGNYSPKLASTSGSAYKAGELSFRYCRFPNTSLIKSMNTAASSPVKFVGCTIIGSDKIVQN